MPDLEEVAGDATQLQQVLLNLCVNARDAMPEGGKLMLGAENTVLTEPLPGTQPESRPGSYVVLRVQDNGSGMSPEVLEHIFEPFFTTKELGNGTGLGLPTALGIVRSHGGFLRVLSEMGEGSTFEVYLPAAPRDPARTRKVEPKRRLTRGGGELVLVVDDEASVRNISRELLSRFGYSVLSAGDGAEAIALVKQDQDRIKLVVTDLMMPNVDGLAMTRELKRLSPRLEVIATSGLTNDPQTLETLEELRRLGVKHFLAKPYNAETLLRHVHLALHPETAAETAGVVPTHPTEASS
jgi:CheY-like chemotaxis protein